MQQFFLISIGAILGANSRYYLQYWASQKWGTVFPYGTLLINLTGSFIIGLFLTLITDRFIVDPRWRTVFAIGFLGSYTTFSSYTFESIALIQQGQWGLGLFNLLGSAILGGVAVYLGVLLGRLI